MLRVSNLIQSNNRRGRTRDALLQAGLSLFAERPVDAVPIDDIVAAAGVAKGSFFNHFDDKQQFANAIASEIRRSIEESVTAVNEGVSDPLQRLTRGMMVAAHFALTQRERAIVLLRGSPAMTARDHPLNAGLRQDMEATGSAGFLRAEAHEAGLLFWLGACQMLMANLIERPFDTGQAALRMSEVMVLALTGLGIEPQAARDLARERSEQLTASLRSERTLRI